jgi:hypothetical protein
MVARGIPNCGNMSALPRRKGEGAASLWMDGG